MVKREIGYDRISSARQKSGQSIEAQDKRIREVSEREKLGKLIKIYIDKAKSAYITNDKVIRFIERDNDGKVKNFVVKFPLEQRPEFANILDLAEKKQFDILRIFKFDRYARGLSFQEETIAWLEEKGIEVKPTDDLNDKVYRRFIGTMNEKSSEVTGERVDSSNKFMFDKGLIVGKTPFGYDVIKDKEGKTIGFEPNEDANTVRSLFKLKHEGKDYKEICFNLDLSVSQFYAILHNKTYAGYIRYGGEEKKGLHKPLIDLEMWDKCQR